MPSSHLIVCHPLLLLPPIPLSIRVFSNDSTLLMRWPKYWSFSFSIIPSKEIPGLNSFRMDCLDLLAVQESSKASILRRSAFFTVQLSHPYMITGKTIALTRWTFVGKVMSLLSGAVKVKKKARTVQACSLLSLSSWFSGTGKKKTHSSFFPFSLATHTCHSSLVTNPTYYV